MRPGAQAGQGLSHPERLLRVPGTLNHKYDPPRRELAIARNLDTGVALPVARVGTTNFAGMNWVLDAWGVRARIRAGIGARYQLREAMEMFSPGASHETVFTHSGWRKLAGGWRYLHQGGEIGTVAGGLGRSKARFIINCPTNSAHGVRPKRETTRRGRTYATGWPTQPPWPAGALCWRRARATPGSRRARPRCHR